MVVVMFSGTNAEEKPLLNNNLSKGVTWEKSASADNVPEIHVHVDNLHNGLNRREKFDNCHASDNEGTVKISLPPPERDEMRFPPEKWKTFLAFIFLVLNMVWTLTVLSIVHERMPDRTKYPPLPDVFFDVFPPVDWALDISESIIIISVLFTLLMTAFHKHRFIIFRRCFIIIGLLYFMRGITMFVTQVPVASTTYYCSPKANSTSPLIIIKRVLHMMSGFGLSINGYQVFCGDYIYSGHTVILTLTYLVIREYSPRRCGLLHWIIWVASCAGIFLVLLARGHYMVDVIIGYYASSRVFWIYHTMANNSALKVPGNNNFLSRLWWFSLFMYFEKNVDGVVPRQYEWPFPWPRRFSRHTRIS